MYKVGDRVVVLERTHPSSSYRCCFVDQMAELAGQVFTITSVTPSTSEKGYAVPDDGYKYTFKGCHWTWSSGMFKPFIDEKGSTFKAGDEVRIKERVGEEYDYKFGFTEEMMRYSGRIAIITGVIEGYTSSEKIPDDGCKYKLDVDFGRYNWASSMFESYGSKTEEKSIEKGLHLSYSTQKESYKLNFNI